MTNQFHSLSRENRFLNEPLNDNFKSISDNLKLIPDNTFKQFNCDGDSGCTIDNIRNTSEMCRRGENNANNCKTKCEAVCAVGVDADICKKACKVICVDSLRNSGNCDNQFNKRRQ